MPIYITDSRYYSAIASAIRSKNGQNTKYKPSDMAAAIDLLGDTNGKKFKALIDSSITEVTASDLNGVAEIRDYAFYKCVGLKKIVIPDSVTKIGSNCFDNCTSLTEVICLATTPPTLGNTLVFNNVPEDCIIYVPTESLNAYRTAQHWSERADFIFPTVSSFTVGADAYSADRDMTWAQWLISNYNSGGFKAYGNTVMSSDGYRVLLNGNTVYLQDKIVHGERYDISAAQTITFTIDGIPYYAGKNMSFDEWVTTEYNTGGFVRVDGRIIKGAQILDVDDITEHILNGGVYVTTYAEVSFNIAGVSYAAKSGMTWSEWLASAYNTDSFTVYDNMVISSDGERVITMSGNLVYCDEKIEANGYFGLLPTTAETISFTIDGTPYQAGLNMSFDEWVTTEYNTAGFESVNGQIVKGDRVLDVADITAYIVSGRAYATKEQAEPQIISFTVDGGFNCQAYEGMTWAEWCANSEFNNASTVSATLDGNYVLIFDSNYITTDGTTYVTKEQTIIADFSYTSVPNPQSISEEFLTFDGENFITSDNKIFNVRRET